MKKYLKTPEEVISALKEGKTVHSDCGEYKIIDGVNTRVKEYNDNE